MPRRDSENIKYLGVAGLLCVIGGILLGVGLWAYTTPTYGWDGYAAIIIGISILMIGIPLLLSGLSRTTDERRRRSWEERRGSSKRRRGGRR